MQLTGPHSLPSFACLLVAAIAASDHSLAAQYRYETAPVGHATKPGNAHSQVLGQYSTGRIQLANGTLRGRSMYLSELSFRIDPGRPYSSMTGTGRSWARVDMDIGNGVAAGMRKDWKNFTGKSTQVFSGGMAWRVVAGTHKTPKWSSHTSPMPFLQPFYYKGDADLVLDFRFTGGKLQNGKAWGSTVLPYVLDGAKLTLPSFAAASVRYHPHASSCNDGLLSHSSPASIAASAMAYAMDYPLADKRGKLMLQHQAAHTAPNAPVLQAASLGGNSAGFNVGAGCNRLYLSMPGLLGTSLRQADAKGLSGSAIGSGIYATSYLPEFADSKIWLQGAWVDSKTGVFSLTQAVELTLPGFKKDPRSLVYAPHVLHTVGTVTTAVEAAPLLRFRFR